MQPATLSPAAESRAREILGAPNGATVSILVGRTVAYIAVSVGLCSYGRIRVDIRRGTWTKV